MRRGRTGKNRRQREGGELDGGAAAAPLASDVPRCAPRNHVIVVGSDDEDRRLGCERADTLLIKDRFQNRVVRRDLGEWSATGGPLTGSLECVARQSLRNALVCRVAHQRLACRVDQSIEFGPRRRVIVVHAVQCVSDCAGEDSALSKAQGLQGIDRWCAGVGAANVEFGRVRSLQLGGTGHRSPALRITPHTDRGVGGQGLEVDGCSGGVEYCVRLRHPVEVAVHGRGAQTLVIGDDHADALGNRRVYRGDLVLHHHVESATVGDDGVEQMRRRALIALAVGADGHADDRAGPGLVPRGGRLEVRASHSDGRTVEVGAAVHQAGAGSRERAAACGDAERQLRRLGPQDNPRAVGDVAGWLIEARCRTCSSRAGEPSCGDEDRHQQNAREQAGQACDGGSHLAETTSRTTLRDRF